MLWVTVIFFVIVAICAVGAVWETRKRRAIYGGARTGAPTDPGFIGPNTNSVYGHGNGGWGSGIDSSSYGDCGGGGGGGDGGGSC